MFYTSYIEISKSALQHNLNFANQEHVMFVHDQKRSEQ